MLAAQDECRKARKELYVRGWHSLNLSPQAFRQHKVLRIAKWNSTTGRTGDDDRKEF
jgi:hypothetical protein